MKSRQHQKPLYQRYLILLGVAILAFGAFCQSPQMLFVASPTAANAAPQLGDPNDVTVATAPQDSQLFQRNPNTNKANVGLSGMVDSGSTYSQIIVRVDRNGASWDSKTQALDYDTGDAPFQIEFELPAERAVYDFALVAVDPQGEDPILNVTDVVVGDIFLINGQSNANAQSRVPTDRVNGTISADVRKYIRSFGSREDTGNETDGDLAWHEANGDSNWGEGAIGQWAMRLGQRIVEEENIPVALLNGAVSGTRIQQHMRNDADPDDLDTIYGRLLWRAQSAKIANDARALFWYQGESDQQKGVDYGAEFATLYGGWETDYPNVEKVYVFQIRNTETTCGPADIVLREAQRRLGDAHAKVALMSTTAIDPQVDGCHFPYTDGYRKIADHVYGLVGRDLYGGSAENVQAPNIDYAYFSNSAHTEITLVLRNGSDTAVWGSGSGTGAAGPHLDFRLEGSGVPAVTAGSASGNQITLTLDGDGSTATGITYLGHSDDLRVGEWVTNLNGIGLLAFHNAPIGLPPTIAFDAPATGAVFEPGTTINLSATASDEDGAVVSVGFFRDGQPLGGGINASGDLWAFEWADVASGTYQLSALATDNDDISATSAPVTIRVNAPPSVSLVQPTQGLVANVGDSVSLSATASDSDGEIAHVDFYSGDDLLGAATGEPWEISWTPLDSGSVQLKAIAFDNDTSSANSAEVSIRVNAPPTVNIDAPTSGTSFIEGAPVEIRAAAADGDGLVKEVRFYVGTTLLHTDTEAPWQYTWTTAALGAHQLTVAAVDSDGAVSNLAAQVGITVVDANATPTPTPTPTPSETPTLTIAGDAIGAPGSHFVLEGRDFAANVGLSIEVDGVVLDVVQVDANGAFAVELVTSGGMLPGSYEVAIIEVPNVATQFVLDADSGLRKPSSGNRQVVVPLADGERRIYLPEVRR